MSDAKAAGRTVRRFRQMAMAKGFAALACALPILSAHGLTSQTRVSSFDYDPASGLLKKEVVEPANSALCLVTEYGLDGYGHRQTVTTRNCNGSAASITGGTAEAAAPSGSAASAAFTSRSVSATYTADQRFVATTTNALQQSETSTFDGRFGVATSTIGPNSLTTAWAYDDLGRKLIEKRADGNGTKWTYAYCNGFAGGTLICPTIAGAVAAYAVTAVPVAAPIDLVAKTTGAAIGAYVRSYYDSLGRDIRTETQGADVNGTASRLIYQDTEYNALGQVARKSNPYFSGDLSYWTSYGYDTLSRVTSENRPTDTAASGAITTTSYSGLTISATDPLHHTTTHTLNVLRQVAVVTDHLGGTLTKTYDPNGDLVQTVDALGNTTSLVYDVRGRKTALYDPDMGVWTYAYNAVGDLISQTSARGQTATMAYDVLGRLTQRSEPTVSTTWTYDKYADSSACSKGIGKLCQVISNNGHSRKIAYDSLGRLSSTATNLSTTTLTSGVTYDVYSRVSVQTYPTGLAVRNTYTTLGFLNQVVDNRTGGATLWTATSMTATGQLRQFSYGNGVATTNTYSTYSTRLTAIQAGTGAAVQNMAFARDDAGRIVSRTDNATGVVAGYTYDELNRVRTESRFGGAISGAATIEWTYDAIGNVATRKEDGSTNTYNYNGSGSGSRLPHAVMSVSGTVSGVAAPNYHYDADGNLTSGAGRTVTWTSFDKAETMTRGGTQLQYTYDDAHERAQERYYSGNVLQRTTFYLNPGAGAGLYYEQESGTAGTKKKHYITAGGTTIAMIVCTVDPCTTLANTTTTYWHKDDLGSTSVITNASGAVTERLAYEAFGKRRNSNGVTNVGGVLTGGSTDRGFTGHEHIEEMALINMNGRVYDPGLGQCCELKLVVIE